MKNHLLILVLVLMITGVLFTGVSAATKGDYGIDWWTVDGGGGTSEGGIYSLSGTIGQPDGGGATGGDYALWGGFWSGGGTIFSDLFQYIFPLFWR